MRHSHQYPIRSKASPSLRTLPPNVASTFLQMYHHYLVSNEVWRYTYLTSVAFCTHNLTTPIGGRYWVAPAKLPGMFSGFHSTLNRIFPLLHLLKGHQSLPATFFASNRSSSLSDTYPTTGSLRKSRSSMTSIVITEDDLSAHINSCDASQTGLLECLTGLVLWIALELPPTKSLQSGLRSPDIDLEASSSLAWCIVKRTIPTSE